MQLETGLAEPDGSMPAPAILTPRQREANKLLASKADEILLVGGSRAGKSWLAVRALVARAIIAPGSRHAIVRFRHNHVVNSIARDTLPSVLDRAFPGLGPRCTWDRSAWIVELPNKSQIYLLGLDDQQRSERILGLEFATILAEEISQISFNSISMAKTRLAQKVWVNAPGLKRRLLAPKLYCTMNPGSTMAWPHLYFVRKIDPTSKVPLVHNDRIEHLFMNPTDNLENVSESYLRTLENLPEIQRRRFLEGRFQDEIANALWTLESFKYLPPAYQLPQMRRVVVAVDPSGARGEQDIRSDEIGIVVTGQGIDDNYYVLADRTLRASPETWARQAINAYHEFGADCVLAETNFGKDLVRHALHSVDRNIPFREVTASRGKAVRAEPVSSLYAQGRVFHADRFPDLEDQCLAMSSAGWTGTRSPDRLDALVWGLSHLSQAKQMQIVGMM
jgi:Terminase RNaseH-like domain/Phage terminase large subunit